MARKKKSGDSDSNDERTNFSDETFGLPEIHYEPIRKDSGEKEPGEVISETTAEETEPVSETVAEEPRETEPVAEEQSAPESESAYAYSDAQSSPLWPKILGLVAVLVLAAAAVYYFLIYKPRQDEAARQKELALQQQQEAERKRREEEERLRLMQEEKERRMRDSLASIPKTGTIETLEQRTGQYYVIVASAVDGDLIMDYAKKLSQNGVNARIIPPFGKYKFYRLAVDAGDTFMAAQARAEGLKPEYGEAVWVLKY
ncbi:MAG: hypothetical protein KatS3mg032_0131 [Cyclobacteriaceae bacterium]|nr:MAG: hypothetical protein KatS3mg032_0131 [Cyclobacteriaceae bacterium]